MNKKYSRLSSSKQYNMMGDIIGVLHLHEEAIMKKANSDARFATRRNALEVLRKIAKSIILCDEQQIRHELMKDGYILCQFADNMIDLARGTSVEERKKYKEGLYKKLVDLQNDCKDIDMEGLQEVYAIFDGVKDEDGDGGGNGDEEE
jgi:hypothetical protein